MEGLLFKVFHFLIHHGSPPRPSPIAVRHGHDGWPWVVRFDRNPPMGRGRHPSRPYASCGPSILEDNISGVLQYVSLVLLAWHHRHPLRPYRDTNVLSFFVAVDILQVLSGFILNTFKKLLLHNLLRGPCGRVPYAAIIAYPSAIFTIVIDQQTHIFHSYKVRFQKFLLPWIEVFVASASTFQIATCCES
jgi:hypothetical protein